VPALDGNGRVSGMKTRAEIEYSFARFFAGIFQNRITKKITVGVYSKSSYIE
jgi:hypothetical protein